jgi:hypothetical protein
MRHEGWVDLKVARIAAESQRRAARAIHECSLCHADVGSNSLAICLWPVRPPGSGGQGFAGAEPSRFSRGRARVCQRCITKQHEVRVPARSWDPPGARHRVNGKFARRGSAFTLPGSPAERPAMEPATP